MKIYNITLYIIIITYNNVINIYNNNNYNIKFDIDFRKKYMNMNCN